MCSPKILAIVQPASQQLTQSSAASSSCKQQQQHMTAESFPARLSLPLVNRAEQDIYQLPAAEPRRLTDEFPFSYSMAKDLPHIFGNLQEDKILSRPLTPSFDAPTDRDPSWNPLALESDQAKENQASPSNAVSPNYGRVQASRLNSCCFGNGDLLSSSASRELSCGFISKGRSFRFCRQD